MYFGGCINNNNNLLLIICDLTLPFLLYDDVTKMQNYVSDGDSTCDNKIHYEEYSFIFLGNN